MSDKEKQMIEKIAALPEGLQQRFVDRIDGAAMALDELHEGKEARDNDA